MVMFTYNTEKELKKYILNGGAQEAVYEFLEEMEDLFSGKLSEENLFEYFEAQFDDFFISWEEIQIPRIEVAQLLHDMIEAVYKRWQEDQCR